MTRDERINRKINDFKRAMAYGSDEWKARSEAALRKAIAEPALVVVSPELVERGATALCGQYERSGGIPWAELPEDRRDVYRYDFQTALEAALAREATDAS